MGSKSCCLDCPDRTAECHAICITYKREVAEKQRIREKRHKEQAVSDYFFNTARKIAKKSSNSHK